LDILIPSAKIAIEYNGLLYHSEKYRPDPNYHLDKTLRCAQQGYRLFHIFENEWKDARKQEIWKSILTNALGKTPRKIGARKCKILPLDSQQKKDFLVSNHLQGDDTSSVRLGLFHESELVMVATFGKARYSKKAQWELLRMASKLNTLVIGGAQKLMAFFEAGYPGSLISYANRRYSQGAVYEKLGFELMHASKPGYYYTKPPRLYHRSGFQKHMLEQKLKLFDPTLSEIANMANNGYLRVWDCGQLVYIKGRLV
jgi:hypothetical protein